MPPAEPHAWRGALAALRHHAGWLCIGLGLAAVVVAVGVMFASIRQSDAIAQLREQEQVANGLGLRQAEIRKALMTETVWDEAVIHLDQRWDPAWAYSNLIQFFTSTSGFEAIYVLDGDDRPRLAHVDGGPARPSPETLAKLREIAAILRKAEARRPPFAKAPSARLVAAPIEAGAVTALDGRIFLLAGSLVQPDFGHALPSRRAPIVFVGKEVDAELVGSLGRAYLLDRPEFSTAATPAPGRAYVALNDDRGRRLGYFTWRARHPATELVSRLALPIGGCIVLAAASLLAFLLRERAQRRALLAARMTADSANEAKTIFLANMSHEIRTPLNGVLGMAQVLKRSVQEPAQVAAVDTILTSGQDLSRLLSDVLDLSKIQSGRFTIEQVPFDLAECIRSACEPFRTLATEKGLSLEIDCDVSLTGLWSGDGLRIGQILTNLVSNAVKFTEAGGVSLRATEADGRLRVEVEDTGAGIPPERLEAVFEEYVQADDSMARTHGGTGLGLAISRRLALLMDGELTATSRPGRGSTFRLDIPLQRTSGPLPEAAASPDHVDLRGVRILAAEDNATNRAILRALLEPFQARLTLVENGAEAVAAHAADTFDVVLMDIQMPVLDGVEAARKIRAAEARRGDRRAPLIALSANVMRDQVASYHAAGFDAHVAKPIQLHELVACIDEMTRKARPAAPATAARSA